MLLTEARYRAITGDATAWSTVSARVEEAVELLEEDLDRGLAVAERTELLHPTRDGWLWPHSTPIVTATGWTVDGLGVYGAFGPGWPDSTGRVSVTYTGGWVERSANPNAPNRLPVCIERDLAFAAFTLEQADPSATSDYPAGVTSVRLGDAAVTFGPEGAPGATSDAQVVRWSRKTLAYRYRTERGA